MIKKIITKNLTLNKQPEILNIGNTFNLYDFNYYKKAI